MHYTLHLTSECNFRCDYCYVQHNKQAMTEELAYRAIDQALALEQLVVGIAFFGGEPLLQKDLIKGTVRYANNHPRKKKTQFYFKLTTNGSLLDEEFIKYCKNEHIYVAVSLDGGAAVHNKHRRDCQGNETFTTVSKNAGILLKYLPNSPVMLTINPDTVIDYADSVEYLFDFGFIYLLAGINYQANWDKTAFKELKKQYDLLADFYFTQTMAEKKFYLSPFDGKISSHIKSQNYCDKRCDLGKGHVSIAPNGDIYPCVEFINNAHYKIGDVFTGIDQKKRASLFAEEKDEDCLGCAIRQRCNHYCSCQNLRATGYVDRISPLLCQNEQLLLPIADKVAERLYKRRNGLFIQKQYNEYYPILSVLEDKIK